MEFVWTKRMKAVEDIITDKYGKKADRQYLVLSLKAMRYLHQILCAIGVRVVLLAFPAIIVVQLYCFALSVMKLSMKLNLYMTELCGSMGFFKQFLQLRQSLILDIWDLLVSF